MAIANNEELLDRLIDAEKELTVVHNEVRFLKNMRDARTAIRNASETLNQDSPWRYDLADIDQKIELITRARSLPFIEAGKSLVILRSAIEMLRDKIKEDDNVDQEQG